MRNSRDLFKNIGDIKEVFHAGMGIIKDRNSKDLAEAKEIKKRLQSYHLNFCHPLVLLPSILPSIKGLFQ